MTVRHILLTVAALAVFGLGLYLFFEVRATPATADAPRRADKAPRDDAPPALPAKDAAPSQVAIPEPNKSTRPSTWRSPPERVPAPPPEAAAKTGTEIQKLDALMSEASKAYDRGEFDEAKTIADKALKQDPTSVRMLRIMVSASCIDGNSVDAQKWYLQLPPPDREQMKVRCDRYGVSFNEK